jgi:hypothetical protein
MRLREVADRRQLGAGPQMPVLDLSLDTSDDLVDEALLAVWTNGEGEHSDCPLAELARSIGQYSQIY